MTSNATSMGIQSQVCHTAIDNAEKHLGAICEKIGSINRKQAKIRDRGDELAHNCVAYAVKELPSMRLGLDTFGKHLSTVQDYRQAYIDQVDTKCLSILSDYGKQCANTRSTLKKFENDRKKETKKIDGVQKAKNPNKMAQSQHDLVRLNNNVKQSTKLLEDSIIKFEEKRMTDVKHVLMEYCRIEMTFAAKCLEQWSECYQKIAKISTEEDMLLFQQNLSPQSLAGRLGLNTNMNGLHGQDQSIVHQLENTSLTQPTLLQPSASSQMQNTATPISTINRSQATLSSHTGLTQNNEEEMTDESGSEYETDTEGETTDADEIETINTNGRPKAQPRTSNAW